MGAPWTTHGHATDTPQDARGLSVGCAWFGYGLPVGCPGLSVARPWVSLGCSWGVHGLSVWCWDAHGHSWRDHGLSVSYEWGVRAVSVRFRVVS